MTFLLDTNICIAAMKQEPVVMERLSEMKVGSVGLPAIVLAELAYGAARSNASGKSLRILAEFGEALPVIAFDFAAAHHYGKIRAALVGSGKPIGPNDLFIAATALAHNAILVTRNVREFSRVPGLRWETI
jgi:tRNA(fMet)-specific endonuclease VapC